jgi:phosphoribosylformylglycinamidine synthase
MDGLAGSEYLRRMRDVVAGRPAVDINAEVRLQRFLVEVSASGLVASAHDISHGGLAVALSECAIERDIGITSPRYFDLVNLFSETQSRAVVSCSPGDRAALEAIASRHGVPLEEIGMTGDGRLSLGDLDISIGELRDAYESGLPRTLEGVTANV